MNMMQKVRGLYSVLLARCLCLGLFASVSAFSGYGLARTQLMGRFIHLGDASAAFKNPRNSGGRRPVTEQLCCSTLEGWLPGKPMGYIEPVFRPPAEAGSLILQVLASALCVSMRSPGTVAAGRTMSMN